MWAYPWCAKDTATLEQNFKNIKVKFTLDGEDVTDQMSTVDVTSNGQQCRLVFTALSDWPAGEHHLTTDGHLYGQDQRWHRGLPRRGLQAGLYGFRETVRIYGN